MKIKDKQNLKVCLLHPPTCPMSYVFLCKCFVKALEIYIYVICARNCKNVEIYYVLY